MPEFFNVLPPAEALDVLKQHWHPEPGAEVFGYCPGSRPSPGRRHSVTGRPAGLRALGHGRLRRALQRYLRCVRGASCVPGVGWRGTYGKAA